MIVDKNEPNLSIGLLEENESFDDYDNEDNLDDLMEDLRKWELEGGKDFGRCSRVFGIGDVDFLKGPGKQSIFSFVMLFIFTIIFFPFSPLVYRNHEVNWYIIANGILHIFTVYLHIKTSFMDPGFVKRKPNEKLVRKYPNRFACIECLVTVEEAQSEKYTHCWSCLKCTKKNDHHCIVLGMCIAKNNLCTFYCLMISFAFFMNTFFFLMIDVY